METKKCKYCGVNAETIGYESFKDGICPICERKRPLFENPITLRKSGFVDLGELSYCSINGAYIEVTEWSNGEGFEVEVSYGEDREVKHFSFTYDEYEAMVNIVHSFGSFEPVIYTRKSEN